MTTRKLQYKAIKDTASTHVGKPGDIFYDPDVAQLRMYDGNPGGMTIGGGGNTALIVPDSNEDQDYVLTAPTQVGQQYSVLIPYSYNTGNITFDCQAIPTADVLVWVGGIQGFNDAVDQQVTELGTFQITRAGWAASNYILNFVYNGILTAEGDNYAIFSVSGMAWANSG